MRFLPESNSPKGRSAMAVRSRTRKAAPRRAAPQAQKWVYLFANKKAEGNAKMRDLLGGKGAGLAEMTNAGRPVRAWHRPGEVRARARCEEEVRASKERPRAFGEATRGARERIQGNRPQGDRETVPDRAAGSAAPRDRGGVRLVVRSACQGL